MPHSADNNRGIFVAGDLGEKGLTAEDAVRLRSLRLALRAGTAGRDFLDTDPRLRGGKFTRF